MCGVAGALVLGDGPPPSPGLLDVLLDAQAHRGPDGEGRFADGPVVLGSRRLALVDPAGGGQPLASEDGAVQVVANGELYDDVRERRALEARGHRFGGGSDCEVLVHRYEDRGLAFTDGLRGMWAAGLWDGRERRLVLARDPFGIKPLVYARLGDLLVFASELGALLRLAEVPRELDPVALEELLAFGAVLGERTIVRAVRRVPAGSLLVAEDGVLRLARVARPVPVAATELRREPAGVLAGELRERLGGSVRAHLRGDARVGVLLSGGLDSGAICALAAAEAGPGLPTFTVGFEGAPSFDERGAARRIAARHGTEHHEVVVGARDAETWLPAVAAAFDEPRADATALPYWLAGRAVAGHGLRCVLSGEGGDELLGGYQTYVADRLGGAGARAAALLAPLVALAPSSSRRLPLDFRLRRMALGAGLDPLARHVAFKVLLDAPARSALLRSGPLDEHARAALLRSGPLDEHARTALLRSGPLDEHTRAALLRSGPRSELGGVAGQGPALAASGGVAGTRDLLAPHRARFAETEGADLLARLQDVDLGTFCGDDLLGQADRAGMAHGVEVRVPFLDPEVAGLALALPPDLRVRGPQTKRLLRMAAGPLLPRDVVRGAKKGFVAPAAAWLRGPLEGFARELLGAGTPLFATAPALALLDRHVARREDLSRPLWGLMALALWHDAHLSRPPARRPLEVR